MSSTAAKASAVHAEITAVGESAVRVEGRTGHAEQDWLLAHKLAAHLHAGESAIYTGALPTYESVLVEFDAVATDIDSVIADLTAALPTLDLDGPLLADPQHFRVPVLYGALGRSQEHEPGPDMTRVAELTGLSVEEVIARHIEPRYVVRCLGAPGGSPMLDGPQLSVTVPRLPSPRPSVPQGAVSLAGRQATITPATAPGGWCVIGQTPLRVLDLDSDSLVPYRPGDTLEFYSIGGDEFRELEGQSMVSGVTS